MAALLILISSIVFFVLFALVIIVNNDICKCPNCRKMIKDKDIRRYALSVNYKTAHMQCPKCKTEWTECLD